MNDSRRKKLEFLFGGCLIVITLSAIVFGLFADTIITLLTFLCGPGWMEDL